MKTTILGINYRGFFVATLKNHITSEYSLVSGFHKHESQNFEGACDYICDSLPIGYLPPLIGYIEPPFNFFYEISLKDLNIIINNNYPSIILPELYQESYMFRISQVTEKELDYFLDSGHKKYDKFLI